jgi:helix-turn-helix protein
MGKMIELAEAARRLGVDPSRVGVLCRQRRIKNARLIGRQWFVPEDFKVTPGTRGPKLKGKR